MWEFIEKYLEENENSIVECADFSFTYKELQTICCYHGGKLKSVLSKGDTCIILCKNNLYSSVAILSCWYAGVVPVPLTTNYGYEMCREVIKNVTPALLITDSDFNINFDFIYQINEAKFVGDLISLYSDSELNEIAVIMHTSGTFGIPKGVMIEIEGLKRNIEGIVDYMDINMKDKILISRPIYHISVLTGEFLVSIFRGLDIYFSETQYNPFHLVQLLDQKKITVLGGTPTMLSQLSLYMLRGKSKHIIATLIISGECLNEFAAKKIQKEFFEANIYSVYGLTEAAPRVSYLPPELFNKYHTSVGIPLKNTKIKIISPETGMELENNQSGLVFVSSLSIMKGYYRNNQLTRTVLNEGWLNTKDIGYKNSEGLLFILGRVDNMINKSGMNIYPPQIENKVMELEEVEECLVYSIKNDVSQEIVLDIVPTNLNIEKKQIYKKLAKMLPQYLIPSQINIVENIPKTASGKILRK
ncbi:hypothetical protein CKN86_01315 [Carnobacterium divergens]|uniref:class I adenylate-forming enzyme family protein n=1 Tax=Carnobacterium divergens TaxID=2748 RepID=UPI000D4CC9AA|nr:class I adenylate-forming enzyme family protein [Carnobacterium divergens]MCO6018455.1 acyl--CoA ligase [Carnobacterium divergens]MPQ22142.1 long-chain fatty acid--CoA ligase [Carnobacterium divergens]TFI65221.1 hypothetical protein CKN62_01315 [Carnobacterium divergens]TFI92111.1 hypothetical protein CKN84_01315 [Carnobacterium divergens]TFJ07334.1 hypothetical protein CKN86_01315 [Carnobacterium divergens]